MLGALRRHLSRFFLRWRRWRRRSFRGVVYVESDRDPRPMVEARYLVLIGPVERPKWARFACPCGCGETLTLNLMRSLSPRWEVRLSIDGKADIFPSVHNLPCNSHFWIRCSRFDWCIDEVLEEWPCQTGTGLPHC